MSMDCLSNKERNTLDENYDNSASCDYKKCDYTCYANEVDIEESKESFIYKRDEPFYDNQNTLFSRTNIDKCKSKIEGYVRDFSKVSFDDIYCLLDEFTEVIISQALTEMLGEKVNFTDRFGFQLYVSSNEEDLFLTRNPNVKNTDKKWIEDIESVTGIFQTKT